MDIKRGSKHNRILLALRAGGLSSETLVARLKGKADAHIHDLINEGLVVRHGCSQSQYFYELTEAGMALVADGGSLCYRKQPTYFQGQKESEKR